MEARVEKMQLCFTLENMLSSYSFIPKRVTEFETESIK
jgi:hypothetical protein